MLILEKENISILPKGIRLSLYSVIWMVFFLKSFDGFSIEKKGLNNPPAPPINFSGEISGNQVQNAGYDPTTITSVSAATTTNGTIVYKWQFSTNGTTWTDIASSNTLTYNPPAITVSTYYRRLVQSQTTAFEATSNVISKLITNYSITTPVSLTAGSSLNLTQTGAFADFMIDELVNGSFTNGTSGFSSDVPLGTSAGNYNVNYRPSDIFGSVDSYRDRFGRGLLYAVRSPGTANQRMWFVTINVVDGNTYDLSAWVRGFNSTSNASVLRWNVGGIAIGLSLTAPDGSWSELATTFTATSTGPMVFSINNATTGTTGNDFSLDDITIYENTPVTYLWTGPNGFSSTSANPTIPNAQPINSGTYTLTVTKNGYSVSVTKVITVNSAAIICLPPSVSLTGTNVSCFGANNGVINAAGSLGNGGLGNITYQYWDNIAGSSVSNLTSNINYPNSPAGSFLLSSTEAPINFLDNYGARMVGYIVPRETGNYTFWVSSDDNSELWISTNELAANKVLRASVTGFTGVQEWNKYASQKSVTISLTSGQIYYIEVLHKESTGGDNLAVGWARPGESTTAPSQVVPPSVIRPFVGTSLTIPVYNYRLNAGAFQSSGVFNNVPPGTHTITLQDAYGCTATSTISVTQPASFSSSASSNSPVCQAGTLNLTAASVSSGTYAWAGPNGFSSTSQNPTVSNVSLAAAGVYTLTATLSGCSNTYTTTVSIVANPVVITSSVNPACGFDNGSITFSFNDDPSQTQISLSVNGGTSFVTVNDNIGTYTFTGLASSGTPYALRAKWATGTACEIIVPSITLTANSQLVGLSLTASTIKICANIAAFDSVRTGLLAGVAPYTFSWSNGGGNLFYEDYNPLVNTTYTVTVTDSKGCTATASVLYQVVNSPTPTITSIDSLICVNGSSTITSVIDVKGTYTYQWYLSPDGIAWTIITGSTNSNFTNSFAVAGNYFYRVIVEGAGGACSPGTSNTFKITVVPAPTAAVVGNNITCLGTSSALSANVSNGVGSITYQWQQSANGTTGWADVSGATNVNYSPIASAAGIFYYRVIATMSGIGCSFAVSPSFTFTVLNPGTITTTPSSTLLCLGGSVALSTSVSGASGSFSYQWQKSSNLNIWLNMSGATGATYSPTNDSLGLRYYRTVVNFSACGLFFPTSVQIQTNVVHTVTATISNQTVCLNGSTILQGTVTNTTGTITYQWESSSSLAGPWASVSGATSINYTPPTSVSGTIYYRLNVNTSANNCGPQYSQILTLNIVPQTSVTITPSNAVICQNGVYTLNSSILNGVGPFTYQWQVSTTGTAGTFTNIAGSISNFYTIPTATLNTRFYKVIVSASGNGCIPAESNIQNITVLPRPTLSVTNTGVHCVGSIFKLTSIPSPTTPTPINSYQWSSSNGFSSNQQSPLVLSSSGAMGGVYTVTATGANQCTNTATTNMTILTACGSICTGQYIIIPVNPSSCTNTNGYVRVTATPDYETSIDGVNWVRGINNQSPSYTDFGGLTVGNYLFFVRDFTTKTVCKNVNITLVSNSSTFFTSYTVTGVNGCYGTNGTIVLSSDVLSTDQVTWITKINDTPVAVSTLSPTRTITGLGPGTYYVKVTRNGEYCFADEYITVPNTGTACPATAVCDDSLIPNLFPNGDFGSGTPENGPVYIETEYGYSNYTCFAPWDGFYSITNNTDCNGSGGNSFSHQASGWWDVLYEDHTVGDVNGYMMVVNAGYTPNIVTEKLINNLCPNTQYNFTAWLRNISPTSTIQPNVSFIIDGIIKAQSGNVTGSTWQKFGFSFKTGSSTSSALFAIRNVAPGGFGNNFIIDDIKVSKCPLNIVLDGTSVMCLGGTNETINATITDPNAEHNFYKWQESNNNGVTWTDVTGVLQGTFVGSNMNVTINLPTPIVSALSGKLYRIRLSTTSSTINDPICSIISQITKVIVPPVTVSVNAPVTICSGTSTSLTALGSGGTTPYTYTWTNTSATGATVSVSPTTSTSYTVTARDVDNCSATATTSVTVIPLPTITVSPATVCSGVAANVAITPVSGVTFSWLATTVNGGITGATTSGGGSGTTITDVLINPGTANATVTYTITASTSTTPVCTSTATVVVTVRPNIVISPPANPTICSGTTIGSTEIGSNLSPTTYSWTAATVVSGAAITGAGIAANTLTTNLTFSTGILNNAGAVDGVIRFSVTPYANGCAGTPFNIDVTVKPNLTFNAVTIPSICNSGDPTAVTPVVNNTSGGSNIFTWALQGSLPSGVTMSPTTATNTIVDLPLITNSSAISVTLTFNLTGTNTLNNCTITATTFTVTINPIPTLSGIQTVCIGSTTTFTGTGTPNATNPYLSSNTSIATVNSSGVVTGIAAGTATITYTDNIGCIATRTVTVNALPTVSGIQTVCIGSTTTFTGTGTPNATNPYLSSNTSIATVNSSGVVTGIAVGTATITYTDNNGCSGTRTVTVNALPTVSGVQTVCIGSTTTFTGTGTPNATNPYVSSNTSFATVNSSGVITGVASGTATITYTDNNGCSATRTVTVNALPTVSGIQTVCVGSTTTFTGTGTPNATNPYVSSNTSIATINSSGVVTGIAAGTATITYTDNNGCGATRTVTVNALPTVLGVQIVCIGSTTIFTGTGTPNATNPYLSSNTSIATVNSSGVVTGIAAGTATITYTDNNGCSATRTVTVNPLPVANAGTDLEVCSNLASAPLGTASTSGYTYSWSPAIGLSASNVSNPSVTLVNSGSTPIVATYTVTTTIGATGCSATDAVVVTVNPLPTLTVSITNVSCFGGNNGTAIAIANGGTSGYSYIWNTSPIQTKDTASNLIAGAYIVTITDSKGCTATRSVVITQPAPLGVTTTKVNVSCFGGNNGSSTVSVTGGIITYSYSWNTIPVKTTSTANSLIAGIYTITVTDANGCVATASFSISQPSVPLTVSVVQNTIGCVGKNNGVANATVSGGSPGYSYSWNTSPNQTLSSATNLNAGNYVITITDLNGCTASNNITITEHALPIPTAANNSPICVGDTLKLTSSGGTIYNWTGPNSFSSTLQNPSIISAMTSNIGIYSVTVTNANGCSSTATTNIIIIPKPSISITSGEFCSNTTISLNANNATTYNWTGPNSFSSNLRNPIILNADSLLHAGKYYLEITNLFGCKNNDSTLVKILPLPLAPTLFGDDNCGPASLDLTATNCSGTIDWYDNQFSGNLLLSGTTFATNILSESKNFFASCVSNINCTSPVRSVVEAKIKLFSVAEVLVANPTCLGTQILNNGSFILNRFLNGETFSINLGSSYLLPVISSGSVPSNGVLTSTLQGPAVNTTQNYNIRITSVDGCPIDKSVTVSNNCPECDPNYCIPGTLNKTN